MGRLSKALLTSSFTFFLISIEAVAVRTNLIQNEKELINLSNLCNFQLLQAIVKELSAIKNCYALSIFRYFTLLDLSDNEYIHTQ